MVFWKLGQDRSSADAKSLALVEGIERIGLEPFHAPEPLPPIQPEDVTLICWMPIQQTPVAGSQSGNQGNAAFPMSGGSSGGIMADELIFICKSGLKWI